MKFNFKDYKKFCEDNKISELNIFSILKFKNAIQTQYETEKNRVLSYINFHLMRLENLEKERVEFNG